jgi:signal transduction histidine kinase
MLLEFLRRHREELIADTPARVQVRAAPRLEKDELQQAIPLFLDQLIDLLQQKLIGGTDPQTTVKRDATRHGAEMLRRGFTVAQVVHDYGDLCQSISARAVASNVPITNEDYRILNHCLDDAIAAAVTEFLRQREITVSNEEIERLGRLAHEQRNLLNAAMLAFQVLRSGNVGIGGSTGAVLGRSLMGLREIIDRSLAEVRVGSGKTHIARVELAGFIEEMEVAAMLESRERDLQLTVAPAPYGVVVRADRQLLASAVGNVLSNAFKFTRRGGHVAMRTIVAAERVSIEVEDECGGLPAGRAEELFRPFEQRSRDRSGLGLGLAIARQAIGACGGSIYVRDLPGKGCVFGIELVPVMLPESFQAA